MIGGQIFLPRFTNPKWSTPSMPLHCNGRRSTWRLRDRFFGNVETQFKSPLLLFFYFTHPPIPYPHPFSIDFDPLTYRFRLIFRHPHPHFHPHLQPPFRQRPIPILSLHSAYDRMPTWHLCCYMPLYALLHHTDSFEQTAAQMPYRHSIVCTNSQHKAHVMVV